MDVDSTDVELGDGISLFEVELHDFIFCTFTLTAEMWTIVPNDVGEYDESIRWMFLKVKDIAILGAVSDDIVLGSMRCVQRTSAS
eukprot:10852850-Ditylum_brightwellii.AAC.1